MRLFLVFRTSSIPDLHLPYRDHFTCYNQQQPHGFPTLSWEQSNPSGNPKGAPCSGREQSPPPWKVLSTGNLNDTGGRQLTWEGVSKDYKHPVPFQEFWSPGSQTLESDRPVHDLLWFSFTGEMCKGRPSFRFPMCRKRASTLPSQVCGRQCATEPSTVPYRGIPASIHLPLFLWLKVLSEEFRNPIFFSNRSHGSWTQCLPKWRRPT